MYLTQIIVGECMFEKEAEEIANKRCHEIMCFGYCSFNSPKHHRCGEWHREYNYDNRFHTVNMRSIF